MTIGEQEFGYFKQMKATVVATTFLLLALAMSIISENANGGGGAKDDVREFEEVLYRKPTPTLADYYRWYGVGAEGELMLMLTECRKENLGASEQDAKCRESIQRREKTRNRTPSLYFAWLRTVLPRLKDGSHIRVQRVERIRNAGVLAHDVIDATVEGTPIKLYRSAGTVSEVAQFGRLSITEINGVPTGRLLHDSMQHSVIERE